MQLQSVPETRARALPLARLELKRLLVPIQPRKQPTELIEETSPQPIFFLNSFDCASHQRVRKCRRDSVVNFFERRQCAEPSLKYRFSGILSIGWENVFRIYMRPASTSNIEIRDLARNPYSYTPGYEIVSIAARF